MALEGQLLSNAGEIAFGVEADTVAVEDYLGKAHTVHRPTVQDRAILELFANGERGWFYSARDTATTWQDAALATRATANGDPVRVMFDKRPGVRPDLAATRKNLSYSTEAVFSHPVTLNKASLRVATDETPPEGYLAAWRLRETAPSDSHYFYQAIDVGASGTFTYSRPVKADGRSKCRIQIASGKYADYDLTGGGSVIGTTGAGVTASIGSFGGGWYKCRITATISGSNAAFLLALDDGGNVSYAGDTTKGLLFAGDQMEAGSAATDYQPVANNTNGWIQPSMLFAASDALRPTLLVDAEGVWLHFDGTDALQSLCADLLGNEGITTMFLAYRLTSENTSATRMVQHAQTGVVVGTTPEGQSARGVLLGNTIQGALGVELGGRDPGGAIANRIVNSNYSHLLPRREVAVIEFDPGNAVDDARIRLWVDGELASDTTVASAGTPSAAMAGTLSQLTIGGINGAGGATFDLADFGGMNRALSDEEKQTIFDNLLPHVKGRELATVTDTDTPLAVSYEDSAAPTDAGGYFKPSTYARLVYDTTAGTLEVASTSDIFNSYPEFAEIGVEVDGAFYASMRPGKLGDAISRLALPNPGTAKRVAILTGLRSKPSSTVLGTYIKTVAADAELVPVDLPSRAVRYVVYGDSIAVGDDSRPPSRYAWPLQVRRAAEAMATPRSLLLEGYGGRALWDDCVDATARAAFVAKIVAEDPTHLWLAIGTNDYGLNRWSASAFGTAYAALLDDLHAALPSLTIYAQTPIVRSSEVANTFGNTTGDYRSQIATAQSTRSSFVTLVDGTTILTTADLSDGVHPTTAGHTAYAAFVETTLGIA